jgi:hypothetical protein
LAARLLGRWRRTRSKPAKDTEGQALLHAPLNPKTVSKIVPTILAGLKSGTHSSKQLM